MAFARHSLNADLPFRRIGSGKDNVGYCGQGIGAALALRALLNEDWLAVAIGLLVFALALFSVGGIDLLGWAATTSVYTDITSALAPVAKAYAPLGGVVSLLLTYAALLARALHRR